MNTNPKEKLHNRLLQMPVKTRRLIVGGLTAIFAILFLEIGFQSAGPGFPLDDAWIHQTYARNLAFNGRWEFIQGQVSGGSTSPLWTMLLSLGPLLGFKTPYFWTSFLSIAAFTGTTLTGFAIIRKKTASNHPLIVAGVLLLALEWHLLWSAVSGMETILFCFLCLLIFNVLLGEKYYLVLGLLSGLIVWVRPDGLTMLGPVFLILFWRLIKKRVSYASVLAVIFPILIMLGLYGWFNYSTTGTVFPTTMYAKQLEYADTLQQSIFLRMGKIFLVPVSGAGLFLIPGFIQSVRQAIVKRDVWLASAILWFIGYGTIYAIKLPMVYQHGRYHIPLIPIFFMIGIIGTVSLYSAVIKNKPKWKPLAKMTIGLSGVTAILFAVVGQTAFINDIRTIERLMIEPAEWINANTPDDALIAAHDIGAMGYFGERDIIDLAGLIEPEIIPIIRNESAIREYLIKLDADYLVVFEDWYPDLKDFGKEEKQFDFSVSGANEIVEIRNLNE